MKFEFQNDGIDRASPTHGRPHAMKTLGYRDSEISSETPSEDFLSAIQELMQLRDSALTSASRKKSEDNADLVALMSDELEEGMDLNFELSSKIGIGEKGLLRDKPDVAEDSERDSPSSESETEDFVLGPSDNEGIALLAPSEKPDFSNDDEGGSGEAEASADFDEAEEEKPRRVSHIYTRFDEERSFDLAALDDSTWQLIEPHLSMQATFSNEAMPPSHVRKVKSPYGRSAARRSSSPSMLFSLPRPGAGSTKTPISKSNTDAGPDSNLTIDLSAEKETAPSEVLPDFPPKVAPPEVNLPQQFSKVQPATGTVSPFDLPKSLFEEKKPLSSFEAPAEPAPPLEPSSQPVADLKEPDAQDDPPASKWPAPASLENQSPPSANPWPPKQSISPKEKAEPLPVEAPSPSSSPVDSSEPPQEDWDRKLAPSNEPEESIAAPSEIWSTPPAAKVDFPKATPVISSSPKFDLTPKEPEPILSTTDFEQDILSVPCPACNRGLKVQRQFLGVSGECVWCHHPVVAFETFAGSVSAIKLDPSQKSSPTLVDPDLFVQREWEEPDAETTESEPIVDAEEVKSEDAVDTSPTSLWPTSDAPDQDSPEPGIQPHEEVLPWTKAGKSEAKSDFTPPQDAMEARIQAAMSAFSGAPKPAPPIEESAQQTQEESPAISDTATSPDPEITSPFANSDQADKHTQSPNPTEASPEVSVSSFFAELSTSQGEPKKTDSETDGSFSPFNQGPNSSLRKQLDLAQSSSNESGSKTEVDPQAEGSGATSGLAASLGLSSDSLQEQPLPPNPAEETISNDSKSWQKQEASVQPEAQSSQSNFSAATKARPKEKSNRGMLIFFCVLILAICGAVMATLHFPALGNQFDAVKEKIFSLLPGFKTDVEIPAMETGEPPATETPAQESPEEKEEEEEEEFDLGIFQEKPPAAEFTIHFPKDATEPITASDSNDKPQSDPRPLGLGQVISAP